MRPVPCPQCGRGPRPASRRRWRLVCAVVIGASLVIPAAARGDDSAADAIGPPGGASVGTDGDDTRASDGDAIEFRRVHVPAGRLADVPLGVERYVPLSAREFEAGVQRLGGGDADTQRQPLPLAAAARYELSLDDAGALAGELTIEIDPSWMAGTRLGPLRGPSEMALGPLDARRGWVRSAAGRGEALVFGRRDGTLAIAVGQPGDYGCEVRCRPLSAPGDAPRFSLPLPAAFTTTIELSLPAGTRPVVAGLDAALVARASAAEGDGGHAGESRLRRWRITTGPRAAVDIALVAFDPQPVRLKLWTTIGIGGREAVQETVVEPVDDWLPGVVRLDKGPGLVVTDVGFVRTAADDVGGVRWRVADGDDGILLEVPTRCLGSREPLLVRAVAPVDHGVLSRLTTPAGAWAGGGVAIRVAPALSIASIEPTRCQIVPPEAAARWPLPSSTAARPPMAASLEASPGVAPAEVFVEEQAPASMVALGIVPRLADLDLRRVTTVDLSPGQVVGRASCDVRVLRGECFELSAHVTPGWFIDSVEAVALATGGDSVEPARRRDGADPAAAVDWKVQRGGAGDVLRIALTLAANPARGLGLRIAGHRAGVALGEDFPTAAIDMVRFDGESFRTALLDLRTSPETIVEFDTRPAADAAIRDEDAVPTDLQAAGPYGRLGALLEEGPARARLWAGVGSASRVARLVRRRPPVDARTEVRLTVRDDRLTESFTFLCHPTASDLDSLVVQFAEFGDEPLEWTLLPSAAGAVSARPLGVAEEQAESGDAPRGRRERWLLEISPPARGPITIRAARTIPFTREVPVPLAWVEGATSGEGEVVVRSVGRVRPRVVNRRLREVPYEADGERPSPSTVAVLSFPVDLTDETAESAAAELVPGGGDAQAWAWQEETWSWVHASGATEYETRFDLENQGRAALSLSLPAGRQLQGIMLDGVRMPLGPSPALAAQVQVELPPAKPRLSLVVRMSTAAGPPRGRLGKSDWSAWPVEAADLRIDVPVLERRWRVLLPSELELAYVGGGFRRGNAATANQSWLARLLGATWRRPPGAAVWAGDAEFDRGLGPAAGVATIGSGFRSTSLVASGNQTGAAVIVVHARVLAAAAVLAAVLLVCATAVTARTRPAAAVLVCLLAGLIALWAEEPFAWIARSGWWAAVCGCGLSRMAGQTPSRRRSIAAASAGSHGCVAVLLLGLAMTHASAGAEEPAGRDDVGAGRRPGPVEVFVIPPSGGNATDGKDEEIVLVPERLFKLLLAGDADVVPAGVRVLGASVTARLAEPDAGPSVWSLAIDVDADAGGVLVLDQSDTGASFVPGTIRIDGATLAREGGGRAVRIPLRNPGRYAVTVDVRPGVERHGEIESATVALPVAASARIRLASVPGEATRSGIACERALSGGGFEAVPPGDDAGGIEFAVPRAERVRLVRATTAGIALAAAPTMVESQNDIAWDPDGCHLVATFGVDGGESIVRSLVVAADPGLEWIAPEPAAAGQPADGVSVRPLPGRRFLVERRRPERGRFECSLSFRMPLGDPVGVFPVPGAWVEDAAVDARLVRFAAGSSLAARIDLPAGFSATSAPDGDASPDDRWWREDVVRGVAPEGLAPKPALPVRLAATRPSVTVERRLEQIRGSQRATVVFGDDHVRLRLEARLDASGTALVAVPLDLPAGCRIDRVALFEDRAIADDVGQSDAGQSDVGQSDAGQSDVGQADAIDVRWTAVTEKAALVLVQQPRAGRFRLDVEAHLPGKPAARGMLPCLRAGLSGSDRVAVEWRTDDGLEAWVGAAAQEPGSVEEGALAGRGGLTLTGGETASYRLVASVVDSSPAVDADAPPSGNEAESPGGRVEFTDVRIAIDDRGRLWGLASFDLVSDDRGLRLRLPRGWRLFDVLVDGRQAEANVAADATQGSEWLVPLLDAGWPRRVVVLFTGHLFAGEHAGQLHDGEPLALAPPEIVGLPCRFLTWTLRVPDTVELRFAAPARGVTAAERADEHRVARDRLAPDFERAIERTSGRHAARAREVFESWRLGSTADTDRMWAEGRGFRDPQMPATDVIVAAGTPEGNLTMRAVRRRDPTLLGRGAATLCLLGATMLMWQATRAGRRPLSSGVAAILIMAAAGVAWLVALVPSWPGVLLLGGGLAMAARAVVSRAVGADARDGAAADAAPSAPASVAETHSTRTAVG